MLILRVTYIIIIIIIKIIILIIAFYLYSDPESDLNVKAAYSVR